MGFQLFADVNDFLTSCLLIHIDCGSSSSFTRCTILLYCTGSGHMFPQYSSMFFLLGADFDSLISFSYTCKICVCMCGGVCF
jgi:hypothetical protein